MYVYNQNWLCKGLAETKNKFYLSNQLRSAAILLGMLTDYTNIKEQNAACSSSVLKQL